MTKNDGTKELDLLFGRITESPWRDRNATNYVSGESRYGTDEQTNISDIEQTGGVVGGLVNGFFDQGPVEDELAIIDTADNDLPGWTYVEVAGTWQVTWAADANAHYGYSLAATQAASAASNEFYLEQTILIAQYRRLVTSVLHSATHTNMGMKIAVAFLDSAAAVIGSELSVTKSITTQQLSRFWREPPALAVEARIRIGVVNAAGSTGQTATLLMATVEEPTTYTVDIPGVYSFLSPSVSTRYNMGYPSDVIPGGVYKADTEGFVLGVNAKTNDAIAAGTIACRVENDTAVTTPGPSATLQNGTLAASARSSLDGVSTYHFAQNDELHLELSADGSLSTTGSADYFGTARLLLVVNDEGDWA